MADSALKLYYFDGRGRAEVARLILAAAGKEYEDLRFSEEEWPKYKPLTPYGQVPALQVDDVVYAQSNAIFSFLAREFGFLGGSSLEIFKIDEIVNLVNDFVNASADALFHTDDPAAKEAALKKVKEVVGPRTLGFLEVILEKNGTGYLVGDKLSLADIVLLDATTGGMASNLLDVNDDYPLVKKTIELVKSNEKIGKYLATRKDSPW
ncbi:unnamed protein product [Lymnaea stagnalis]